MAGVKAAWIGGIDALPVVVGHNAAEYDAFDLRHGQLVRWELVKILLLQLHTFLGIQLKALEREGPFSAEDLKSRMDYLKKKSFQKIFSE